MKNVQAGNNFRVVFGKACYESYVIITKKTHPFYGGHADYRSGVLDALRYGTHTEQPNRSDLQ